MDKREAAQRWQGLVLRVPVNEPPLVVIHPDGTVTLREGLALDEASRAFWEHVGGTNAALRDRLARAETRERAIRGVMREMEEDEKIPRKEGDFTGEVINYYRRELTDALAPTDGAARAGDAT
jgi:hypothetical protein